MWVCAWPLTPISRPRSWCARGATNTRGLQKWSKATPGGAPKGRPTPQSSAPARTPPPSITTSSRAKSKTATSWYSMSAHNTPATPRTSLAPFPPTANTRRGSANSTKLSLKRKTPQSPPSSLGWTFAARARRTSTRLPTTTSTPTETIADVAVIRNLIEKYAKSVDAADTALAGEVWLDSPDVSFIHPLGHEHGFEQIKQNVYTRLMGEMFLERKLSVHDVSVHVYGDAAWAEFYWDFVARVRKDGSPLTTHGRETQLYQKIQGRWRLVHVHYSCMPVTAERQGF